MKSRNEKADEYIKKYNDIPLEQVDRLNYLYDKLKINDKKAELVLEKKFLMESTLSFKTFQIILYEEPEGSPRPRFRIVNRKNLANMALSNPHFVHVYSITGYSDRMHMERLLSQEDFSSLNDLIYTPCNIVYDTYFKTPSYFNATDTILAEIGLNRPITCPDWDNIGKKYSDMSNKNIWLDDNLVVDGTVRKFYSILPRVEINISYLNMLYNKHDYKKIYNKTGRDDIQYFGG